MARHGARASFTCVEMRDCEHPPEARCSPQGEPAVSGFLVAEQPPAAFVPETSAPGRRVSRRCCAGLLHQVVETAAAANVALSGENALQRYDHYAFDRIAESAFGHHARAGRLETLTFLRMGTCSRRQLHLHHSLPQIASSHRCLPPMPLLLPCLPQRPECQTAWPQLVQHHSSGASNLAVLMCCPQHNTSLMHFGI